MATKCECSKHQRTQSFHSRCPANRPIHIRGKAKVAQFNATPFVEEAILELEVPMYDALLMYIGDGETQLAKYRTRLVFGESALFNQIVKELAACAYFCG